MDYNELKGSVERIQLPPAAQARIIANCRRAENTEEIIMEKHWSMKKAVLMAAAVVLCLTVGVSAAGRSGAFRDIVRWDGAVTGQVYEQATDEIAVTAAADGEELAVTVEFLNPDAAPYREEETLAVGRYQITDSAGKVLAEGEGGEAAAIVDGTAQLRIPLTGLPVGEYRLAVAAFIGEKKADQPLEIRGGWSCTFSK